MMPRAGERVVVAMSGGVDSSVAAALLAARGLQVIGISLRLAPETAGRNSSGCCSLEDFQDAAQVAQRLDIPHYVFDMRGAFDSRVVRPFVEEYLSGRTPSPCILCNREIKFGLLQHKAAELGASFVATGHYARRELRAGRWRLLRGRDEAKDQSYFLFEMGQKDLARTLFPVGGMTKDEVRAAASRLGLATADKAESQEICFVPDGRYAAFVERLASERVTGGSIVDEAGNQLGHHAGIHRYTVGQRRGLGVAAPQALYVKRIDSSTAKITVAPRARVSAQGLYAESPSWVGGQAEPEGTRAEVRIRHHHRPAPARLHATASNRVAVRFDSSQEGVSPGQAAVFYRGDEVVGGGWIAESIEREGTRA